MKLPRMFNTPKHQQYEYKPRFYDEKEEKLQELLKSIEGQKNGEHTEISKDRISSAFRSRGSKFTASSQTYRSKQVFRSNMILIGVIVFLVLVTMILLNDVLPDIMKTLE